MDEIKTEIKNETKNIEKKMEQFVVIGLGRFGRTIATTLASLGKEVLAIDSDAQEVHSIESLVSNAVVADVTTPEVLYSLGVQNFDCAVVCIGDNLEASILATLICKELGVSYVVTKAQNEQHKKVLEKIGADMVVFPEVSMGKKVANTLANPSVNEISNLTGKFKIIELSNPDIWDEKTILETNIRKKYKVSILFIKRGTEVIDAEQDTVLKKGDLLILAGEITKLDQLSNQASEAIDINHTLHDALKPE